ncbi:hypothetical protein [Streptomyces sp. SBT349]|uniref:hypothetical protein n=1 Tax=Streptomyces sp. SBT349 TaxID=1580539 RepID=UPI000AE7CE41|nr:hypothetical protein [Streptomyces sp. SBT349]
MDGQPRSLNRHPLICGAVAAGALCVGWLLPSAYADGDDAPGTSSVIPVEQPALDLDQDQ